MQHGIQLIPGVFKCYKNTQVHKKVTTYLLYMDALTTLSAVKVEMLHKSQGRMPISEIHSFGTGPNGKSDPVVTNL